jgi:hypothetical protein
MSRITSRRAVLAGIGTAPAMSVPALASVGSNASLTALAEQLKPLLADYFEAQARSHAAYEAARKISDGFDGPGWSKAMKETGYDNLSDAWNALSDGTHAIAKAILEIPSMDRIGDGIHAVAAMVLNEDMENAFEVAELLCGLAENAGFPRALLERFMSEEYVEEEAAS